MTDHTTHDLAIARAERDAWQSTCEELHRTIAGRDVEIEAHLGRCEAADQRARSFEAALTAEREASKGLVAQVEAVRADSRHHAAIAAQNATLASERDAAIAERDACAYDLRAIRDLVAPGNPQGTVVDAVRARLDAVENAQAFGIRERDAAIARAEKAEADLRSMSRARDSAIKAIHESDAAWVKMKDDRDGWCRAAGTANDELSKLRAEVAELTVTRDRLLAREHEDGRLHAQLRVELAELRARPVLTEDLLRGALDAHGHAALTRKLFAHLGPVALPSPDRAEELTQAIHGTPREEVNPAMWRGMVERTRSALASLGAPPTSPPAARPVFAWVSASDLDVAYIGGQRECHRRHDGAIRDCCRYAAVAAVLARLEATLVAPVDPEEVARAYHNHAGASAPEWDEVPDWIGTDNATENTIAAMRTVLTAAGIPVTPEVGK